MPACRQMSLTGTPASACLRIETIWVSVKRDFFMEPPGWGKHARKFYLWGVCGSGKLTMWPSFSLLLIYSLHLSNACCSSLSVATDFIPNLIAGLYVAFRTVLLRRCTPSHQQSQKQGPLPSVKRQVVQKQPPSANNQCNLQRTQP